MFIEKCFFFLSGSKILPYLNMSNSQQQLNSQTQNGWPPSNFTSQLQTQQQQNSKSNQQLNLKLFHLFFIITTIF